MSIKTIITWILAGTAIILLFIILILSSIEWVAFDMNFYEREYKKLNISQSTGMDDLNLMRTTKGLLDYLKGKRQDLNISAVIHGQERLVFNQREIEHMVDVRNLFSKGTQLRKICLLVSIGIIAFLFIARRRMTWGYLFTGYLWVLAGLGLIFLILLILMYKDFTPLWNQFHYIFFTNDLWLLDPETDVLIQMVPEEFFFNIILKIVTVFSLGVATLGIVIGLLKIKLSKT